MSSNVENANLSPESQVVQNVASEQPTAADQVLVSESVAELAGEDAADSAREPAVEPTIEQPAAVESAPEPQSAPAPLPTITEDMIRTKLDRARALSDTKELHLAGASDEVAIEFQHVTKTYNLYSSDRGRFLGLFNLKRKRTGFLGTVNANDDLSFRIMKGEAVAFLGLNGAGKSTALKMITGVTHPTKGKITVNGRVSALLELSAGFDANLSGRENIHLRGQILGLSEEQLAEIEPKAVDFAELGMYIDQPMRSYSSGMKARLGFALAVSIQPEILIIDEALSVGDRKFKAKCVDRIREIMMDSNVTVLFVTHSTTTAQEFCSRGIVLDHGKKLFDGTMDEAMEYYETNI